MSDIVDSAVAKTAPSKSPYDDRRCGGSEKQWSAPASRCLTNTRETMYVEFQGARIVAQGISARGPQGCAFANVSLDVGAGQLAVIAGSGGSGRTSLLLALAGRMQLITGTVRVDECLLPGDARDVQRCVAVAQAPPAIDLDDHLRVGELVAERAMIGGATATSEAVHELFEILGFDVPPDRSVGELRPPDRTLLAVSLAAAERPSVVVIDNADAGCGAEEARRVWSALQMLAARGCTVLASSTQIPDIVDAAEIAATVLRHPLERVTIPAESEVYP
jgi:ABC-2 type transport system ATP-binding protein